MKTILLVDDNDLLIRTYSMALRQWGYHVIEAASGGAGLTLARKHLPDLIVSDIDMPRLNGFDLTRQVKSKFGLPVILVTGREKEEHRREGLAVGADAFVVKSTFEDQGLLEIVQQFL